MRGGCGVFYLLATVLFSLVVALFAMQNATTVTVSLGFWHVEASLALVVIGAAALGILAALPIWIMMQVQLRFRLRKTNNRLKELEQDLSELRKTAGSGTLKPKTEASVKTSDVKKEE